MTIRPVREIDRAAWQRMRELLWPADRGEHAREGQHGREIERYFAGELREPLEVLLAFNEEGEAVGFIELSIRAHAEGCLTDRVAFVEGWYVDPAMRGRRVGAALIESAEGWARAQGCTEIASDAEVENMASAAAHVALGFTETAVIRCFKKALPAERQLTNGGCADR